MSFQMQLAALAAQEFKAPVCIRVPTNELDKQGQTIYQNAHFIGLFKCVPVDQAREDMKQLEELRENGTTNEVLEFASKQLARDFIGFEPHPKHPFPFLIDEEPAPSTPENIRQLLLSKEARDAIQAAYNEARTAELPTKNSKK